MEESACLLFLTLGKGAREMPQFRRKEPRPISVRTTLNQNRNTIHGQNRNANHGQNRNTNHDQNRNTNHGQNKIRSSEGGRGRCRYTDPVSQNFRIGCVPSEGSTESPFAGRTYEMLTMLTSARVATNVASIAIE